ncbi:unnamed protein product, partial [Effrenium voratum]
KSEPVEEPNESPPEEKELPKVTLRGASAAARAALRWRQVGTENVGPEGRLVRRHPLFQGTSKEFREQLASAVKPLDSVLDKKPLQQELADGADLFEPLPAQQQQGQVLLQQGEQVPERL